MFDGKIQWRPHPGPQTEIFKRMEREILYGGARGGGKTAGGRYWMIEENYVNHPLYKGLVIRKHSTDLQEWIEDSRKAYHPLGAKFGGNPPVIRFPSGAIIWTGHLKDENAYEKYQGWELHKILIEELTHIPRESDYEKLRGSSRSTVPELLPQVLTNANPGGPGHVWVKERFVKRARNKTYIDKEGNSRIFIPAKVYDNPTLVENDPGFVNYLKGIRDEKLRKAWLEGDWDVFIGQFFDMWDEGVHVIEPFEINPDWSHYRAFDWGYTAPSCMLWIAVDFDGNHYIYRELYEPNLVPERLTKRVLEMTPNNEYIIDTLADPSIWAKNQQGKGKTGEQATWKSIQQLLAENGLYCNKANNDRPSGWQNMRELIYWDKNCEPKLKVFNNCKNFIRTIPGLIHDDKRVEDVHKDSEDHAADAARYGLMHTVHCVAQPRVKTEIQEIIEKITNPTPEMAEFAAGI